MNKAFRKRVVDHLYGPTGSIIIHIVVFFVALKLVQFASPPKTSEIEVMIMEPEAVDIEELEELKQEIQELDIPDVNVNVDVNVDAPVPEDVTEFQAEDPNVDFDALDVVDNMSSPLVMSGLFAGRSAAGRSGMLNKYGGRWSEITQRSVIRALEWLKNNQRPDGAWGKQQLNAMTGLGLLTFLAHGETPGSEDYGKTVEKAIRYLVDNQNKSSGSWGREYAHAISTYAISEAYGLTRIPELKGAMERGVAVIIKGQQPGGGWDYGYKKGDRRDTSVVGWHVQALKAAYLAGAENPGIQRSMALALEDLRSVYSAAHRGFAYTSGGATVAMTGVGALCLQLLGYGEEDEVKNSIAMLKERTKCDWDAPEPHAALYGWYYITQVMFHKGGSTWRNWNNEFARTMTSNQNSDGSWDFPYKKNGKPEHGANMGPVYSTTLSALMLQVYYRNLPTFQEKAIEKTSESEGASEDEIVFEII